MSIEGFRAAAHKGLLGGVPAIARFQTISLASDVRTVGATFGTCYKPSLGASARADRARTERSGADLPEVRAADDEDVSERLGYVPASLKAIDVAREVRLPLRWIVERFSRGGGAR